MSADDWHLIGFTAWVAALSTLVNLPFGLLLAWLLARRNWWGKSVVETWVALPLVLPPVATGLILLRLLGRRGVLGGMLQNLFGIEVVFTWKAVVIALSIMSFPLLVRSARVAFEEVNPRLEQIASTLGAGPLRVFISITLPLAARGILSGTVLAFARSLGEFGATMMLAGNIPGKTSTLALAIYQSVQTGEDDRAYRLLLVSILLAFGAVGLSEWLLRRKGVRP
jgi:molybdate transport system permease protein